MKTLIVLVFGLALLGLGSALQCYTCDKGVCDKTKLCSTEDSCLSVTGGDLKHKQCIKYSDCSLGKLSQMFAGISSLKFSCCTSDLCNTASLSVASQTLVGLLLSIVLFWWYFQ